MAQKCKPRKLTASNQFVTSALVDAKGTWRVGMNAHLRETRWGSRFGREEQRERGTLETPQKPGCLVISLWQVTAGLPFAWHIRGELPDLRSWCDSSNTSSWDLLPGEEAFCHSEMGKDCRAEPRGRCRGSSGMVTVGGAFQPVVLSCPQERDGYSDWQVDMKQQIGGRAESMRHKLVIKSCVVRTREQTKGKSRGTEEVLSSFPSSALTLFCFLLSLSSFHHLSFLFCHCCLPSFSLFFLPDSIPFSIRLPFHFFLPFSCFLSTLTLPFVLFLPLCLSIFPFHTFLSLPADFLKSNNSYHTPSNKVNS